MDTPPEVSSWMKDRQLETLKSRRLVLGGILGLAAWRLGAQLPVASQKPGSIIVPFPAGHDSDVLARILADLLEASLGSKFVVEDIPGAGGILAANQFLKRPRDGSVLLLGHSGLVCNVPLLAKTPLGFEPQVDFVPVCMLSRTPFLMAAGRDHRANDLNELKYLAKAEGDPLMFSSSDPGSGSHIAGVAILRRLGITGSNIPYRDSRQAAIDVSEGRVPVGIFSWQLIAGLVRGERLKVLALLSDTPLPAAPNIPTLVDQGFGGFDFHGWYGLFVAQGAPQASIEELERQFRSFQGDHRLARVMKDIGAIPAFRNHNDSRRFIAEEIGRHKQILSELNLV